jgi:chromosomal replication initiator protein
MPGTVWDEVLGRIETKVNQHSYHTWFRHTTLDRDDGERLVVRVADPTVVDWLVKHYTAIINEALTEVGRAGVRLEFRTDGEQPAAPDRRADVDPETLVSGAPLVDGDPNEPLDNVGLSPRYSFETFIVGASNQFAHAACRAVAEAPSRSYNPLFLYGGVGLGKTHLMHAIGHYVLTRSPGLKLTYISAERFMNEVVNAIRYDRIMEFRERYRGVDVLLVDDIQFIVGKERTQTEFFHTFNALHDAQKQIVLSSDCPPHQISELEERLRSRFEWGLIADIQPPDLETKIAILKRKAESEGVQLPDDVALYIAGRIKSNIRELEGSLIRLLAYASLTGRDISMALAQEVLRDVLRHDERVVTIDSIQKFVCEYYQLKLVELKSKNNSKSIALPRQVAM